MYLATLIAMLSTALVLSADPKKSTDPMVIILAGDADAAGAQTKWAALQGVLANTDVSFAAGFPKIVQSADYKGLKPGFHIVVAGFCDTQRSAEPFAKLAAVARGAYRRPVQIPLPPGQCPGVRTEAFEGRGFVRVKDRPLPSGVSVLLKKADYANVFTDVVVVLEQEGRGVDAWRPPDPAIQVDAERNEELSMDDVSVVGTTEKVTVSLKWLVGQPRETCTVVHGFEYPLVVEGDHLAIHGKIGKKRPTRQCGE